MSGAAPQGPRWSGASARRFVLAAGDCDIPTEEQVRGLSQDWASRAELPSHVVAMLNNFPSNLHPMAQFSAAMAALHSESKFSKAYADGVHKSKYWDTTFEDSMDLIAKLPAYFLMPLASILEVKIYQNFIPKSILIFDQIFDRLVTPILKADLQKYTFR